MGKIPWTQWDRVNRAILRSYLQVAELQARLAVVADGWAGLPPPRARGRGPTRIYKRGGAKSLGPNQIGRAHV